MKLYDVVRKADVPKQRLLEATRGAILARQSAGVPLLVEQLRSADKALFAIGLRTARELPGREVTDALVAELGRAAPDRQALLILALADRGDAAALPALLASGHERPRQGCGSRRSACWDTGQRFLSARAAGRGDGRRTQELSQAAAAALAELRGKEVDDALLARLTSAQGKARQVLIQLAGERRITGGRGHLAQGRR